MRRIRQAMFWKRAFLEDKPAEVAGGGGGGKTEVLEKPKEEPKEEPKPTGITAEQFDKLQADYNTLKADREKVGQDMLKFQEWYQQIAPQIEIKDGKVHVKGDAEDIDPVDQKIIDTVQRTNVALQQQTKLAEAAEAQGLKKFNQDPFYDKIEERAKEIMRDVPIHRQTEKAWVSACNLARGEMTEDYVKLNVSKRDEEHKVELQKQRDASIIVGGEQAGEGEITDEDVKGFRWTPTLRSAAMKQIDHGMVKTLDQWARAYLRQKQNKGGE